jgi:ell wall binding domain 2 (CWB2)
MDRFPRIAVSMCVAALAAVLLAPSVALGALDQYERTGLVPPYAWDNYPAWATTLTITPQVHTFQTLDPAFPFLGHDEDWFKFSAVAGSVYGASAYPSVGSTANPVIMLYATNGSTILRESNDVVIGVNNARLTWTCPANGTYYVRCMDWYGPSTGAEYRIQLEDRGGIPAFMMHRPAAPDRYALAANLALEGWPGWTGVTDVVVACGADRAAADPLAASGLAGVYNAPIMLVQTDPTRVVVPDATKNALAAIRTATGTKPQIHVVGGPASVTAGQLAVLKAYDKDGVVDRIGGADRYAVAAGIAARMRSKLGAGYPKTALFCNGHDAAFFWNALAAGPIAYKQHFPILLTTKSGIPAATNGQKASYTTRYLVGTPTDTYDGVRTALGATRIGWRTADGGAYDRTLVAREVAETGGAKHWIGYGDALSISAISIANRLADALVGGTFTGRENGALLFAYSAAYLDQPRQIAIYGDYPVGYNEEFLVGRRDLGDDAWILGGTASVSASLMTDVGHFLGATP